MLSASAQFHRYSFANLLLIHLARPDATRVAGIRTWNALGRRVRKGERGIAILAPCLYRVDTAEDGEPRADEPDREPSSASGDGKPRRVPRGFRVVYVFDIAQTDGDPVPDVAPVLLDGDDPGRLYDALAAQVAAAGFTLHRAPIDSGANGQTDYAARAVTVRPDVSAAQGCKTLAHELAHVLMHAEDAPASRDHCEVEAESVAYVVCHAAGLDSDDYSLPYVAGWAGGDMTVLRATADRVVTTARKVLDQLAADTGALADVTAPTSPAVEP